MAMMSLSTEGLDLTVPPQRRTKRGPGSTIKKHHAWAVRAVRRVQVSTRGFWNMHMSGPALVMLMEAALRDEFEPREPREGSYFKDALAAVMSEMKGVGSS